MGLTEMTGVTTPPKPGSDSDGGKWSSWETLTSEELLLVFQKFQKFQSFYGEKQI